MNEYEYIRKFIKVYYHERNRMFENLEMKNRFKKNRDNIIYNNHGDWYRMYQRYVNANYNIYPTYTFKKNY